MANQIKFPPDIEDYIHELCATAILRAQQEGKLIPPENSSVETEAEGA